MSCSTRHKRITNSILLILAISVISSGLAYPLGHRKYAVWPWKKAWYMFYVDGGYFYQMIVESEDSEGNKSNVDMQKWFEYPVAYKTRRFSEIRRKRSNMIALANYVCKKIWTEDSKEETYRISIYDIRWRKIKGRRVGIRKPYESQKRYLIRKYPCRASGKGP